MKNPPFGAKALTFRLGAFSGKGYTYTPPASLASGQYMFAIRDTSSQAAFSPPIDYAQAAAAPATTASTPPPSSTAPENLPATTQPASATGDPTSQQNQPPAATEAPGLTMPQIIGIGVGAGVAGLLFATVCGFLCYRRGQRKAGTALQVHGGRASKNKNYRRDAEASAAHIKGYNTDRASPEMSSHGRRATPSTMDGGLAGLSAAEYGQSSRGAASPDLSASGGGGGGWEHSQQVQSALAGLGYHSPPPPSAQSASVFSPLSTHLQQEQQHFRHGSGDIEDGVGLGLQGGAATGGAAATGERQGAPQPQYSTVDQDGPAELEPKQAVEIGGEPWVVHEMQTGANLAEMESPRSRAEMDAGGLGPAKGSSVGTPPPESPIIK